MFSSVFAPFERLFTLSRAQSSSTASEKLETTADTQSTTPKGRKEFIDHLRVPPARKEVPLLDLLQASKRKPATGDFEVVPRTKGVLVLEEGTENVVLENENEDWPHLACESSSSKSGPDDGRVSYAQVAKAPAGSLPLS